MDIFGNLSKLFIRPPRNNYSASQLGNDKFFINRIAIIRHDFEVMNHLGQKIVCSHFRPLKQSEIAEKLPVVIYCHGNAGSRIEPISLIYHLLPLNITLLCFDFTGSGMSEGEFVTLGHNEVQDLHHVIKYAYENLPVDVIFLWGRSMGAYTSLKYPDPNSRITGIIADSPYFSLMDMIMEQNGIVNVVPTMIKRSAAGFIRQNILTKCNLDIYEESLAKTKLRKPLLLIIARDDTLVSSVHSEKIIKVSQLL